jgi:hypothetical protein
MQDKHQWMSHTLFDMAAFCDHNGMDRQRDVLLDAAAALSSSMNDYFSSAMFGIKDHFPGEASSHGQIARAQAA